MTRTRVSTRPTGSWWMALPLVAATLLATPGFGQDDTAALTVAHGISTFGDLRYGPDFEHLDYVNPDAPRGGAFSFPWSGSFDSLHPYTRQGRSALLASMLFESMLESTADEVGSFYCLLCETIAYPEDRSYVIFTLRDEARFSDGTPVTADDVVFSYEILRDEGLPSFRASIGLTLAGAEALDDRRVRFDFNPDAPIRGRIDTAGGLPVFSRASHEASGLDFAESRLVPLIGSGPYVVDTVEVGERVVYRRDPDYWGDHLPINQGRHNYETIRIEYYGDAIASFEGFTSGQYTFRNESSSNQWASAYDFPALQQGIVVREEIPDGTISSGQSFVMNLRRAQFQDVRVREAIALMFNFEWTNQTLFHGLYSPNVSFWENTDLAATGLPSEGELALLDPLRNQLRPDVFTEEAYAIPPTNPDRAFSRGRARQALGLLSQAGWEPGADGMLRNAAGETLQIEFLNTSPLFDRIINPYVENLQAIGIDARLNRVDNAQFTQRQRDYDFDIITDNFPMGYEPGSGLRQYFGSATANDSVFNTAGVADPAIDALVEAVVDAETQEDLTIAVRALDRVLRWERFRVPQWYNPNHWVAYYDMYRYPENLPPYSLGFLDFWWIDPDAEAALEDAGIL